MPWHAHLNKNSILYIHIYVLKYLFMKYFPSYLVSILPYSLTLCPEVFSIIMHYALHIVLGVLLNLGLCSKRVLPFPT